MIDFLLHQRPDLGGFAAGILIAAFSVAVHESAHALAALFLKDPTAKVGGRITLSPRRQLDMVGSFWILLLGFGWGKPVEFSSAKIRSGAGLAVFALAGPAANVVIAIVASTFLSVFDVSGLAFTALATAVSFNATQSVFSLIPIPPLDGFVMASAPLLRWYPKAHFYIEQWSLLLLLAVSLFVFRPFAGPVIAAVVAVISFATGR